MKKTINKWDITTKRQEKVMKIVKVIMTIVFLSLWLPIMIHVITEIFK